MKRYPRQAQRQGHWKSLVSGCVLLAFLNGAFLVPLAEASLWKERAQFLNRPEARAQREKPLLPPAVAGAGTQSRSWDGVSLQLRENLGTLVEFWPGDKSVAENKKLFVIHVQDAHGNYNAQKNSAEILKTYEARFRKERERNEVSLSPFLVCVEGGWGEIRTDWLSAYPSGGVRRKFADTMLSKGEISGEEYLSVAEGGDGFEIYGVEDPDTYRANLKARELLDPQREKILKAVEDLDRRISAVKAKAYDARLQELDRKAALYADSRLSPADYLQFLTALGADLSEKPSLKHFAELIAMEKEISVEKIDQERRDLLSRLNDNLDSVALSALAQKSLAYRLGKISTEDFHSYILGVAQASRFSAPRLERYVAYLQKAGELRMEGVQREFLSAEKEAFSRLTAHSAYLTQVRELSAQLGRHKYFWAEKFSPDLWNEYSAAPRLTWLEMDRGLAALERRAGISSAGASQDFALRTVTQSYARLRWVQEGYYRLAYKRDQLLAGKTVSKAEDSDAKVAFLIAGGFHTSGITSELRKKGVAYCVVRPSLARVETETAMDHRKSERAHVSENIAEYISRLEGIEEDAPADRKKFFADLIDTLRNRLKLSRTLYQDGSAIILGSYQGPQSRLQFTVRFEKAPSAGGNTFSAFRDALKHHNDTLRNMSTLNAENLPRIAPLHLAVMLAQDAEPAAVVSGIEYGPYQGSFGLPASSADPEKIREESDALQAELASVRGSAAKAPDVGFDAQSGQIVASFDAASPQAETASEPALAPATSHEPLLFPSAKTGKLLMFPRRLARLSSKAVAAAAVLAILPNFFTVAAASAHEIIKEGASEIAIPGIWKASTPMEDTIGGIARDFLKSRGIGQPSQEQIGGVISDIQSMNGIADINFIMPGQRILLPVDKYPMSAPAQILPAPEVIVPPPVQVPPVVQPAVAAPVQAPTPTPLAQVQPDPTATLSPTVTNTPVPTNAPTLTQTQTPSATPTGTPIPAPTDTPAPAFTATAEPSATPVDTSSLPDFGTFLSDSLDSITSTLSNVFSSPELYIALAVIAGFVTAYVIYRKFLRGNLISIFRKVGGGLLAPFRAVFPLASLLRAGVGRIGAPSLSGEKFNVFNIVVLFPLLEEYVFQSLMYGFLTPFIGYMIESSIGLTGPPLTAVSFVLASSVIGPLFVGYHIAKDLIIYQLSGKTILPESRKVQWGFRLPALLVLGALYLYVSPVQLLGFEIPLNFPAHMAWNAIALFFGFPLLCGLIGILARIRDNKEIVPGVVYDLSKRMGKITKIRGEQAAGAVIRARDKNGQVTALRYRVVNFKRFNLPDALERTIRRKLNAAARISRIRTVGDIVAFFGHYRYGTSSAPAEAETHPHQWMPERLVILYQRVGNAYVASTKRLSNFITHNGDFDYFHIFGRQASNLQVGFWLERVLGVENDLRGDSPKIAGVVDLLHTQGMWDASARLAYQLSVAQSMADAFGGTEPDYDAMKLEIPEGADGHKVLRKMVKERFSVNAAPSKEELERWGNLFAEIFENYRDRIAAVGSTNFHETDPLVRAQLRRDLIDRILGAEFQASINGTPHERFQDAGVAEAFVDSMLEAFFENDLETVMHKFMEGADGSFGLAFGSSLDPENVILAARGQPISIGFDRENDRVAYASERSALKVLLDEGGTNQVYRWDMDQKYGEIIKLGLDSFTVFSELLGRELTPVEVSRSGRFVELRNNRYVSRLPQEQKDPVAHDISEIPKVVAQIMENWRDPDSLNRQSAEDFVSFIVEKAIRREQEHRIAKAAGIELGTPKVADIVISGIEVSQWVGEPFVDMLVKFFPDLNIQALSSNKTLNQEDIEIVGGKKQIKIDEKSVVTEDTIVLSISQSGQTFSSLNTLVTLTGHVRNGRQHHRLFILSGEPDVWMGDAIGQRFAADAPFEKRIFDNLSGLRVAEPSSLAAVAAFTTLTELLYFCASEMRASFPNAGEEPLGFKLQQADIEEFERIKDLIVDETLEKITGYDRFGDPVASDINKDLIKQGQMWSAHLLDNAWSLFVAVVYTFVTVQFGLPLFQSLAPLLSSAMSMGLLPMVPLDVLQGWWMATLDAVFYIFLAVGGFAYVRRWWQGRPIFARLGKRTIVIGDVPYVHQLLESFVSKTIALSWGFASADVHGGNASDHWVHRYAHRIVRGTLIWLGRPDGRQLFSRSTAGAVNMAGTQSKGIETLKTGPEVIMVSSDPGFNPNAVDRGLALPSFEIHPTPNQKLLYQIYEERIDSLNRLVAGYVFFHAMAKKVSSFWLWSYDLWRSLSGTRVATTASPRGWSGAIPRPDYVDLDALFGFAPVDLAEIGANVVVSGRYSESTLPTSPPPVLTPDDFTNGNFPVTETTRTLLDLGFQAQALNTLMQELWEMTIEQVDEPEVRARLVAALEVIASGINAVHAQLNAARQVQGASQPAQPDENLLMAPQPQGAQAASAPAPSVQSLLERCEAMTRQANEIALRLSANQGVPDLFIEEEDRVSQGQLEVLADVVDELQAALDRTLGRTRLPAVLPVVAELEPPDAGEPSVAESLTVAGAVHPVLYGYGYGFASPATGVSPNQDPGGRASHPYGISFRSAPVLNVPEEILAIVDGYGLIADGRAGDPSGAALQTVPDAAESAVPVTPSQFERALIAAISPFLGRMVEDERFQRKMMEKIDNFVNLARAHGLDPDARYLAYKPETLRRRVETLAAQGVEIRKSRLGWKSLIRSVAKEGAKAPEVLTYENQSAEAKDAAARIADKVNENNAYGKQTAIALSQGSVGRAVILELARMSRAGTLDLSRTVFYQAEEWDAAQTEWFAQNFTARAGLPESNVVLFNPRAKNPLSAWRSQLRKMEAQGRFDFVLFDAASLQAEAFADNPSRNAYRRLIDVLLGADEALVLSNRNSASQVRAFLASPLTEDIPMSLLKLHARLKVLTVLGNGNGSGKGGANGISSAPRDISPSNVPAAPDADVSPAVLLGATEPMDFLGLRELLFFAAEFDSGARAFRELSPDEQESLRMRFLRRFAGRGVPASLSHLEEGLLYYAGAEHGGSYLQSLALELVRAEMSNAGTLREILSGGRGAVALALRALINPVPYINTQRRETVGVALLAAKRMERRLSAPDAESAVQEQGVEVLEEALDEDSAEAVGFGLENDAFRTGYGISAEAVAGDKTKILIGIDLNGLLQVQGNSAYMTRANQFFLDGVRAYVEQMVRLNPETRIEFGLNLSPQGLSMEEYEAIIEQVSSYWEIPADLRKVSASPEELVRAARRGGYSVSVFTAQPESWESFRNVSVVALGLADTNRTVEIRGALARSIAEKYGVLPGRSEDIDWNERDGILTLSPKAAEPVSAASQHEAVLLFKIQA